MPGVTNTLFVALPHRETLTLRYLPGDVTVAFIKARLELSTGFPAECFHLVYGEVKFEDDQIISFNKHVRNGGMLRLLLDHDLLDTYNAIVHEDIQKLTHLRGTQETSSRLGSNLEQSAIGDSDGSVQVHYMDMVPRICCFALMVACKRANIALVKAIVNNDAAGWCKNAATTFGRTPAHIAAANDFTKVLKYLMEEGLPICAQDAFGKTPYDVASEREAVTSARLIRDFQLQRNMQPVNDASNSVLNQTKDLADTPTMSSKNQTICWQDEVMNEKQNSFNKQKSFIYSPFERTLSLSRSGVVSGTPALPRKQSCNQRHVYSKVSPRPAPKSDVSQQDHPSHKHCFKRPPFMAYRTVTPEELRTVAVEYVPLNTFSYAERQHYLVRSRDSGNSSCQTGCPDAPCSSLSNSRENLTENDDQNQFWEHTESSDDPGVSEREQKLRSRREVRQHYSNVKGVSYRVQSANFYKTRYHLEAEKDQSVPKPRPATAGPRYREWKTWLAEKLDAESEEEDPEMMQRNTRAYDMWLSRKSRERSSLDDNSDSEDSGPDEEANNAAYQKWLASKRDMLDKMDKKRKLAKMQKSDSKNVQKDRKKVTIFQLGISDDVAVKRQNPGSYHTAFQKWRDTKTKYEDWKKRQGMPDRKCTKTDLAHTRETLLLGGMTYEEWLGLKERENNVSKLNVHKVGKESNINQARRK